MISFCALQDDDACLRHSPLLRAALLTLRYVEEHGPIPLTTTKAFKRVFVHWAAENFEWPGKGLDELLRYKKALNEYDFAPLEVVHFLLISMKLGRHYKGEFRLTKRGAELATSPSQLFLELIPYYLFETDHSSYARFSDMPFGTWDVWLNVTNVEADQGITESKLYAAFYGQEEDWVTSGWRDLAAFSSCVLRPLEWAGLIVTTEDDQQDQFARHIFKTPLWRAVLQLDTDQYLQPITQH